ncbi:signal peptide peptidase SppA [Vibrio genomosp. F10]|uniref:Signal peptide peptidase SppA n=1 Tax=Vibrio genomosp. F10 str. ZF-129 TaxID=1187848 RepID=A0A1E5BAS7_9VIBR|nr:signal peptide peptidase SppA [Vibrio genomosp. F10]OEE31130.1 signal peptide peptidase SppA [Vibrio genomosp. F10 str. ZF-129]OEE97680.1 signal peptide peptidase SppA [Vibrio genomosp. F10 str. 9ZC157]OEF03988.1 signal peptide peptidase SppA [Vibrio genomosp. F10 str. 9ZB36]
MKKLFKFIGMIFKGLWKLITFIRLALTNLIFILSLAVIYFLFTSIEAPTPTVKEQSALVLNLSGPIVEQRTYNNPMDSLTGSLFGQELPKENVLFDIVETIRHAQTDDQIQGIVLSLRNLPETNLTKLRYIAKALNEFKASGKPIYATGEIYNQSQYYLASYANKVYMSPDGAVLLKGYSAYSLYYKTLLEKLDVNTHVFRVGTYKSAIEPFVRDDMSDEAKESAARWLTQLWGAYVEDVATNRQIDAKTLNPSMDEFLAQLKSVDGNLAELSLQLGLVDELATRQQIRTQLADVFGSNGKDSYKAMGYYEYRSTMAPQFNIEANDIAVVVASGAIMDGEQSRNNVGGDTTANLLRQARNDNKVKAVVLRVDSPGGSAFASEVIRNEIDALRAANKPVVVSMSSLAASGGYWISMSADKIVAQPTTLTGSIGIFSVITTFEKGLNSLGVYSDGIGTSPFSGVGVTTGMSEGASDAFQLGIEHGYKRFVGLVSTHRDLSLDALETIAEGRVWTGKDAMAHGLVDKMGDFDDAISLAAELAELEAYNVYWVEEPLSPAQQFFQEMMNQVSVKLNIDASTLIPASWIPDTWKPLMNQVAADMTLLDSFNDPKGQYAFCLTCQVQ